MPLAYQPEPKRIYDRVLEIQVTTKDFDTEHPTIIQMMENEGIDRQSDEGIWWTLTYMAHYDEGSALAVCRSSDPFKFPKHVTRWPIAKNRRNLYGGRIKRHYLALVRAKQNAKDWPYHNFEGDPKSDWSTLYNNLRAVWGNGRFGTYTTADMLHKVNQLPVEVMDMDNQGSTGPAKGLRHLFGYSGNEHLVMDRLAEQCFKYSIQHSPQLDYTTIDKGVIESVLCNYSGICRSVFYPGRNIDRQQDRLIKIESMGVDADVLWEARHQVFNHKHLGEFNGWVGVDPNRKKQLQKYGEPLWPDQERH